MKKRKDGSYEKKITVGHDKDGKPIRKAFYGHSIKEIDAKIKEYHKQEFYGTVDRSITLAEWADQWLETYKEGNVRANTYETTYRISVDKIKKYFRNAKLAAIRPIDIQEFFNSMSVLSQSALDKLKITLRAIFETAIENELIIRNPVKRSIKPKSDNKSDAKRAYTRDEAIDLVKFAKSHKDGASVITILKTGLRRGELCGLKWSDVDLKSCTINVRQSVTLVHGNPRLSDPKSETSKREIPFDDELKSVFMSIPRNLHCEFVFASPRGMMMNPDNWKQRIYDGFMADYKLHNPEARILNPHELRHTFGTFLYEATNDIYITSKIMGHSNPNVTAKIYVHEQRETKQAAIAKVLPFAEISSTQNKLS